MGDSWPGDYPRGSESSPTPLSNHAFSGFKIDGWDLALLDPTTMVQRLSLFKPSFFTQENSFAPLSPLRILRAFLRIFSNPLSFLFQGHSHISLFPFKKIFQNTSCFFRFPFCNSRYQPCQNSALRRTRLHPPVRKPLLLVASPIVIKPPKYFY